LTPPPSRNRVKSIQLLCSSGEAKPIKLLCRPEMGNIRWGKFLSNSLSILYYQYQSGNNFICINTLLSISIRKQLYLYQYFTININPETTLSVSILYNQYKSGNNFICINTLLSISIRKQLYHNTGLT